jgi:ethanolamine utilization protein EutQ (cupin superfamily)
MEKGYRAFKKGTYELKPFVIDGRRLENAFEISLSEYGSKDHLSCGLFRMRKNSFSLTYPNDEVMLIVAGEVDITTKDETLKLKKGDVLQVKRGLQARVSTARSVEIFFAGYPIGL